MAQRSGGDKRGNSYTRRRRKLRMLAELGDGITVDCAHCKRPLTYSQLEADRIVPGGSYRWENVQPSCRADNLDRSNDANWTYTGQAFAPAMA
jgi:hypothetical protein